MHNNLPVTDWRILISRLIKSEMSKRDVRYEELRKKLDAIGTKQSTSNLRNKINRGILGADLFVQILFVLNVTQLERATIVEILDNIQE